MNKNFVTSLTQLGLNLIPRGREQWCALARGTLLSAVRYCWGNSGQFVFACALMLAIFAYRRFRVRKESCRLSDAGDNEKASRQDEPK